MALEPISTSEAAQRLGVTATTVRRMIAAGRLQAVQEPRPQGARFRVLWDSQATEPQSPRPLSVGARRPVLDELTHLRTRIEGAAQRTDQACQRFGEPPRAIAVAEPQALLPTAGQQNQPDPARERIQGSPQGAPRLPLWRRLWRRRA